MNSLNHHSPFSLIGKTALVLGASKGIGKAISQTLCEAGAMVTLSARDTPVLADCVKKLQEMGLNAQSLPFDLSEIKKIKLVLSKLPAFDIVVYSAGIAKHAPFLEISESQYYDVMSLNLDAAFWVSQASARQMVIENKQGSIIFISSQMGHVGGSARSVYCASKHALEGLTKSMAIELGAHGIRVNTVAPTFVETEFTRQALSNESFHQSVLSKIKLGRLGLPSDVAYACCYLASDAASLVTGTSLVVDGGWTAE
jgi:NAD(P)-dependent dehydrogenase (short-subunit alcohol dehydrogenase family)